MKTLINKFKTKSRKTIRYSKKNIAEIIPYLVAGSLALFGCNYINRENPKETKSEEINFLKNDSIALDSMIIKIDTRNPGSFRQYNEKGLLIREVAVEDKSEKKRIIDYSYNDKNQKIKSVCSAFERNKLVNLDSILYEYNNKGQLEQKEFSRDPDENYSGKAAFLYFYNDKGQLSTEKRLYGIKIKKGEEIIENAEELNYTYDSKGRKILTKTDYFSGSTYNLSPNDSTNFYFEDYNHDGKIDRVN